MQITYPKKLPDIFIRPTDFKIKRSKPSTVYTRLCLEKKINIERRKMIKVLVLTKISENDRFNLNCRV